MTAPLVSEVQNVSKHLTHAAESVKMITDSFQSLVSSGGGAGASTVELKAATESLARCLLSSTSALQDSLVDLNAMGDAMAPVMSSSPEAAPALAINFYSTLARQLDNYFREMSSAFSSSMKLFEAAKARYYREPTDVTPAVSRSRTPVPAPPAAELPPPAAQAEEKPKKKKKKVPTHPDEENREADTVTAHAERQPTTDTEADAHQPPATRFASMDGDNEMQALAAAAAAGATTEGRKKKKKHAAAAAEDSQGHSMTGEKDGDAATAVTPSSSGATAAMPPAELEPKFVLVNTTVEDALGRAALESRPNVFSSVDSLTLSEPTMSYHIKLVKPGSLGYFMCENYINISEEDQADFLCEVLDTDCVEVEPFVGAYGEVAVIPTTSNNFAYLPICAWRQGSNEEQTSKLFTMYVFARRQPAQTLSVIIHDSLVVDGRREEVVHTVTVLPGLPEYAEVRVHSRPGPSGKADAIANFTKAGFEQRGFETVSEAAMRSVMRRLRSKDAISALDIRQQSEGNATFQSNMMMADLAEPQNTGFSLGDVAKGAVRGGIEVLKAPLNIGRTVGGAVLDVTGVTDAMRGNMENAFRKAFPELSATDTIVEVYNAAWLNGAIPNQGFFYVTRHRACFCSTVNSATFAVEYEEIKDIRKAKSAKVFENAIEIITHLGDHYFVTSLLQRDQTFATLMKQWLQ